MTASRTSRVGNVAAMVRVVRALPAPDEALAGGGEPVAAYRRRMLADLCRLLGRQFSSALPADATAGLPPRHVQTLERLLRGDSEKQIARHLGVSPNTVHVYVTALYRRFDVSSRGELLAHFLSRSNPALAGSAAVASPPDTQPPIT